MTEPPDLPKATPVPPKPVPPPSVEAGAGAAPARPESANVVPSKPEPPKPEPPKWEPPKPEPPKTEPPKPAPARTEPPKPAPARAGMQPVSDGRGTLPVLCAVGFLLLVGGLVFLWQELRIVAEQSDPARIATLETQLSSLQRRLATLEQRPAPAPPTPPPAVDLGPLAARIAALEQRPATAAPPDTGAIDAQLAALQARVAQAEAHAAQVGDMAARAARLQQARLALDFGQPLGDIPGAPAALARFAAANPPTEAGLRQDFAPAARQAAAASRPQGDGLTFGERLWQRVTSLVTVRRGDRVISGPPAAVALGQARGRLEAGDLTGAVAALDGLDPPAAQAIAPWRARAQALLDARAALAALARG